MWAKISSRIVSFNNQGLSKSRGRYLILHQPFLVTALKTEELTLSNRTIEVETEVKTNQWLGATLYSTGENGRVVVRYFLHHRLVDSSSCQSQDFTWAEFASDPNVRAETSASLPERKIEKKFQYSFPDFSSPMLFLTFDRLNLGSLSASVKRGRVRR